MTETPQEELFTLSLVYKNIAELNLTNDPKERAKKREWFRKKGVNIIFHSESGIYALSDGIITEEELADHIQAMTLARQILEIEATWLKRHSFKMQYDKPNKRYILQGNVVQDE